MTKLNFSISELIYSDTAIKNNLNNYPDLSAMENLVILIFNLLQPLRNLLAKPIFVSSGFRCNALNKLCGGVSTSHHCKGMAVDITAKNMRVIDLYNFIKHSGLKYTQLIFEGGWVHVSYDENNLKCENLIYDGNKYTPDKK